MENENNSVEMSSRVMLELEELWEQYKVCRGRLHQMAKEVEALREENSELRSANTEVMERLSILSEARMRQNFLRRLSSSVGDQGRHGVEEVCDMITSSPTTLMIHHRHHHKGKTGGFRRNNIVDHPPAALSLPKSISVRSSCYLNMNHSDRSNKAASPHPPHSTQRLHLSRGRSAEKEEEEGGGEVEVEVYNQGMFKTELCDKWQQKGTCPYGDLCQFAHGLTELRPIIRHPRYKTQVCRMVLAGATCPYGHRCHFRHSLCPP